MDASARVHGSRADKGRSRRRSARQRRDAHRATRSGRTNAVGSGGAHGRPGQRVDLLHSREHASRKTAPICGWRSTPDRLQEEDDQLGLAHFLEHMLFNGTENFPDMGVVDFLESIGMEFGPDVNAYTSFDETVYTIQVPTDDAETLNTGLQVLEDWAGHATLDPDAIDQERGIIVEEWRLRYETAAGRIRDQVLPAILGDSRYSDRLPIGDMEIVRNAPPEAFERFYDTWYRPDLMAVIAVGDFDVDEMETLIRRAFLGPADAGRSAKPWKHMTFPTHDDTQYLIVTDPEQTTTDVQVWHKQDAQLTRTGDDYRASLTRRFFYSILNERLGDIQRLPDAPFLSARGVYGNYVDPVDVDALLITVEDDGVAAGLEAVLTEAARIVAVRRHRSRIGASQGRDAQLLQKHLRRTQQC